VITYAVDCRADADTVWALISRPDQWARWAPHVRGARGLGEPEVRTGARGSALLLGALPVPARVTAKQPRRAWTWRVGPLQLRHRVRPHPGGCRVAIDVEAPFGLETLLRVTYGPLIALLVHNLARVADEDARRISPAASARRPGVPTAG
jgi:hypothetical protein